MSRPMKKIFPLTCLLFTTIAPNIFSQEFWGIMPIVEKNVMLLSKPSLQSIAILKFKLGELVIADKMGPFAVVNGKKGRWIYVKSFDETAFGWVFSHYVGHRSRFKQVSKCREQSLIFHMGTGWWKGKLYSNGIFKGESGDIESPKTNREIGYLYRYKNIYCLRIYPMPVPKVLSKDAAANFFFIKNENGVLENAPNFR